MVKLFVVGFPKDKGEMELDKLFSTHGLVHMITVVREMQTGVSKGYAFVTMMDQSGAERAIEALNGFKLEGRTLHVRVAESKSNIAESQSTQKELLKDNDHENTKRELFKAKRPRLKRG